MADGRIMGMWVVCVGVYVFLVCCIMVCLYVLAYTCVWMGRSVYVRECLCFSLCVCEGVFAFVCECRCV